MKRNWLLKILITAFFQSFFSFCCFSETNKFDLNLIFNQKLSQNEKEILLNGNVLIRNTKNQSNIVLLTETEKNAQVIKEIHQLKPVYLAEIIQVIPVSSKPDLLNEIHTALSDISSYKGIPYYSEHNKIWVDLYSKAEIKDYKSDDNNEKIKADFYMEPFGDISADIFINKENESLFYRNINTTTVMYSDITCVKPSNMKYIIYVFKQKDYWILYGIGGVHSPKIPFLSERIELSFMNRIKTFCNFIFTKII